MAAIDDLWHPPPAERSLSENTVHVWQAELDLPESRIQQLAQT